MTPPPELGRLLNVIRRRWFIAVALQLVARISAAAAALVAAAAFTDRWLHPPDGAVLLLSAATIALIATAASFLIWPFRRRPDDARVARFVEERCPELDDTIVSAVDASRCGTASDSFASLVIDGAVTRLRELDLERIFDRAALRRRALNAAFASAALTLVLVLAAPLLLRTLEVARLRYLPGTIVVTVQPGNARVPAGQALTIGATLNARAGALTRVVPTLMLVSNGQARSVPMVQAGERYEVRINAVDRSFTYSVHAGSAASREYVITALVPPRVRRIDLRYEFPSFTGLRPREEQDGGDIFGPAGTRVRVRVQTDKPVHTGRLSLSGASAVPLVRVGDRTYESTLTLAQDTAYRVALADAEGMRSEGTEYFIRLMDDRPPEVHVLRPAGDQQITPLEEVTIEARADDDYGIASFEMVYGVAGGRERVVPFTTIGGTDVSRIGSRIVAAEDLGVRPGDVITYYARARDVARGKQSTLARSEMFFLEVKPFNEEYVAAQSQAMAGAMGTELESLVAAQKEIISATWNLERRSAAGRSAADVKAIADAQAELKARAQQAAGALRPRRRSVPQQISTRQPAPAAGGSDPVVDAVAAMTRAIAQLESRKTREALPHEMEALNGLLKAQADVRRRQVMQQQASGANSGGYGRQGQDLSNLFDRELKRQQRTNYETESHVEQQPENQNSDETALERIRDLARRQEELGRRQREMAAAGLSAEELKRQLETLTREQERLRQQAESLAREMAQQSAQQRTGQPQSGRRQSGQQQAGQPQSGQQAQSGGASSLRDAVEQMRDATSQLARQDPASAAARSEQAARRLRELENQMQTGSPDARRRALGDLQLESQQLAEAQRRIAQEADRLDREGGGTVDARRRLAGEKEQLADRVDALQQSARRLGMDPKSAATERATVNEAARDLQSQQLGARMRAGARDMREQPAKATAGAEQQLADALDRVARRLNGADAGGAKGDAQRLADQLDQVRDARDRLARLEQQVRQAEREQAAKQGERGADGRASQPSADSGRGSASGDLQRLQQEYAREAQRTRDMVDRLQRGTPESGEGGATPEQHEWSRSAPGTEAWKQDYAQWDGLRKDVTRALERYEAGVADRLSRALAADRLRAGGSDRVPDEYQRRIAKYFEALAKKKPS